MNTVMTTSWRTQSIAGVVAALATLLTAGGPLMLADHYAQTGASENATGYYATRQTSRIVCANDGDSGAAMVSIRRPAENS